jgi:hypothetical protein
MQVNAADGLISALKDQLLKELEPLLLAKITQQHINDLEKVTLNITQTAKYTGISKDLLYILCRQKKIPHFKAGAENSSKPTILFRKSSLDFWMEQQESKNYSS